MPLQGERIMTLSDGIAITSLLVTSFIAYNIYFLSKRLSFQDTMTHGSKIRKKVDELLFDIDKGISSKVELINVKKYKKYYPENNEENRHGYTYLGAELKGYSYDGVEFFNAVHSAYIKPDGSLTLKKTNKKAKFNVFEVGVTPYEWIHYVDLTGDDTAYRPQFFVKFNGKFKLPYVKARFYQLSEHYNASNDPSSMKYMPVDVSKE